jgi:hypothetical protein
VLLDQLASQRERLAREFKIDLRVRGILRARQMRLADFGLELSRWREELEQHAQPADLARFVEHVRVDYLPHTVLIDCSADAEVPCITATGWRRASTSSRRTRRPIAARWPTTRASRPRAARAAPITCTRPRSAPACR